MVTRKDIAKGYAGIRMSHKDWIYNLRKDAEIFRKQGQHSVARMLLVIAGEHAAIVIGRGC